MQQRRLGGTGYQVSEIGFGSWALGSEWGEVSEADAMGALHAALDTGVDFFDTADVYGDGRSEQYLARLRRERPGEPFLVATKAGRRLPAADGGGLQRGQPPLLGGAQPAQPGGRTASTCCSCTARRRPSTTSPPCSRPSTASSAEGKVRHYGVSVEKVEEALKAIEFPGVQDGADHLQHLPPAPRRPLLPRGGGPRRRHPGPGAPGQRPAHREDDPGDPLRRRRPPGLQPPRAVLRPRRDLRRRRLQDRPGPGRGAAPPGARRGRRWPSSPCAGS